MFSILIKCDFITAYKSKFFFSRLGVEYLTESAKYSTLTVLNLISLKHLQVNVADHNEIGAQGKTQYNLFTVNCSII